MIYKLIIAGSRDIYDYDLTRQAVIDSGIWAKYKRDIVVVCGMALHWLWHKDSTVGGADRAGYDFAKRNGLDIDEFHPDWKGLGKRAGHVRNADMAKVADQNGCCSYYHRKH